ncbi:MAG: MBL fold metallo-hydrolase [Clostridia bacterium]|nr:MBL fold metallo-hydrolase [Clostridia bacterium]
MKKKSLKVLSVLGAVAVCLTATGCEEVISAVNSAIDNVISGAIEGLTSELQGALESNLGGTINSSTEEGSSVEDSSTTENSSDETDSSGNAGGDENVGDGVDDLSVHFLSLGNKVSGDCTLIKTGDVEVLIDAGSTTGSIGTIVPYIKQYCTDGILEYVIATHGHQDHIAGFTNSSSQGKGIFESFECKTIIDFPKTTVTSNLYKEYVSLRDAEVETGAKHYTALECWNNANGAQRSYTLGEGITLHILYQKYYESSTSNENYNSVCTLITQGENNYLFTGDLEKSGEESLVQSNHLPKCKLFKSGHHGSNTSNSSALLSVIQPEVFVITCCCGDQYNFPHQETIDTVSVYTQQVYVPGMIGTSGDYELLNGNIVVSSTDGKTVRIDCSNNNTLFKDTEWFKKNRTTPKNWL